MQADRICAGIRRISGFTKNRTRNRARAAAITSNIDRTGSTESAGINNMDETNKEFQTQYILFMYEDGKSVSEIAAKIKKTESYVYAQLRKMPEKYEDIKRIREERYNLTLRRVRGLADKITLEYLEILDEKLHRKGISDLEKEKLYAQIDQVQKIGKQYAERVLLAEGKNTQNVGIHSGDIPIEVVIHQTLEDPDDESERKTENRPV